MSPGGLEWPVVGRTSPDPEEHARSLTDEARQLLNFGAPTDDDGSLGKQCPYSTLHAFCTSLLAYLESPSRLSTKEVGNSGHVAPHGALLETPSKATSSKKSAHESPFSSKVFRQISQPFTPQRNYQGSQVASTSRGANVLEADTYGVLILYVPSNFDVTNQERAIEGIISVNKGFVPGISIKSIEWLIPEWTKTKHYGNLLVEFSHPQHANAAIREQLLVGTKVLECEYYERDSRLRQCFFCQQYRHLEAQCQAKKPVCGRCAGQHVTSECKAREDAQYFHCAICGGGHKAWDTVCNVRQGELDRVRTARANAPKYHVVNGQVPEDILTGNEDTPGREFAGTRRYSIDYLVEVGLRGGRRSFGRSKAKVDRQSDARSKLIEDTSFQGPETPHSARAELDNNILASALTSPSGGTPYEAEQYRNWIRLRLTTLGIEPYTLEVPKAAKEKEEAAVTPTPPTPNGRPGDIWDRFAQSDTPSKTIDRTRKSLGPGTSQREKPQNEKAANIDRIRSSGSWR